MMIPDINTQPRRFYSTVFHQLHFVNVMYLRPIPKKNMVYGPYAGVDYTSPYVHSKVDSNTFTMHCKDKMTKI